MNARWLQEAGVPDAEAFLALDAETLFHKLRSVDPGACLHALYGIAGALEGIRKSELSPARKAELKAFYDHVTT